MANNELSGPAVWTALVKWLKTLPVRRYNYKFVINPETIGSICFIAENLDYLRENVAGGFVLSCIGDERAYSVVLGPDGDSLCDRAALHALRFLTDEPKIYSFLKRGSDERQYNTPNLNLGVTGLCKSKYGEYPEYHTSLDDLSLVTPRGLADGLEYAKTAILNVELNKIYRLTTYCEPNLGSRGLISTINSGAYPEAMMNLRHFLAYCDGKRDALQIAGIIGAPLTKLAEVIAKCEEFGLIKEVNSNLKGEKMSDILFDKNARRIDLMRLKQTAASRKIKIFAHRNHAFEPVSDLLNKFLNFSGLEAEFAFSSYDDSLNFGDLNGYDLHILWLDLSRYDKNFVRDFVATKLAELRGKQNAPIIFGFLGGGSDVKFELNGVFAFDAGEVVERLGAAAYNEENIAYSGTRFSQKSAIWLARFLGLKIIPSVLLPNLKAIVVDLDNTLYDGVLGEDGISNLKPRLELQYRLKELAKSGFMLCVCSKNELEDVRETFEKRGDFALKFEDFTAVRANWRPKSQNIVEIAKELNIGLDAMLFIDDNIAEISEVSTALPQIKTILARDEEKTLARLEFYPGLTKLRVSAEDALRSRDIQANVRRENLAKTLSKEEYFKELGIRLVFSLNNRAQIPRISELLGKTNQFILSYHRYNEAEVEAIFKNGCVVTAAMSDRLSDSGIIAIAVCKKAADALILDELVVSCRALGRNIEDIMVREILRLAAEKLKTPPKARIPYQKGPRNAPALTWLASFAGSNLKESGEIELEIKDSFETFGLEMEML